VLTDVVMPGMSGVELARRVRERLPEMPIVYTSGHAAESDLTEHDAGSAPFVGKPFAPGALVSAVRGAMAGGDR
jgi:two-component system, cell cycle sensor histidine kinase and response regulator CckA